MDDLTGSATSCHPQRPTDQSRTDRKERQQREKEKQEATKEERAKQILDAVPRLIR
jgi:hypothetical protein